jgi:hypothetical protein
MEPAVIGHFAFPIRFLICRLSGVVSFEPIHYQESRVRDSGLT